ncbi:MAG: DUF3015 family protein [Desulfomonilia bacterium]
MKRTILAVVLMSFIALPVSVSFAANQKNIGCGLGTLIMKGNDGLAYQVLAVTTNGTCGNQTFGITSGTLDCEKPARFASHERINTYIADNMDNLANDISKGRGEYLNTLAVLMDVPEGARTDFYSKLQNNFSRIYPSTNVKSVDVVKNIEALM